MLHFCENFVVFENSEKVIERCNPTHLSIVGFSPEKESDDIWKSELLGKEQTLRYVLVKLVEERLGSIQIFGGNDPFASIAASAIGGNDAGEIPPMENPPKTAVKGKGWERASYIVRFSSDNTHLGIAGSIMEKLAERVPGCALCLEQSGHGEPVKIAKTKQFYDYATVVGAGFVRVDPEKRKLIFYGRSRAFTISYKSQIVSYLRMTGHEFVAQMLQSELPEGWSIDIINNDVEASIADEWETMPSPEMVERHDTIIDEAMRWFPFLRDIQIERTYIPLEISLSELDDKFLNQSLLEDESEAAGNPHVKKTLYVARGGILDPIDVNRSSRRIYPPEYCHPGMEFPDDESGWSETIREALNRQDLTEAQYIVLYTRGNEGYADMGRINNILITSVKK